MKINKNFLIVIFLLGLFLGFSKNADAQRNVSLTSVSPTSAPVGTQVVITGSNLTVCAPVYAGGGIDPRCNVQFHDINVRRSTVSGNQSSDTQVTAVVADGLCPGTTTIKVGEVNDFSNSIPFTILDQGNVPAGCRVITSIAPTSALRGTSVTINGRNLHANVQLYDSSNGKTDVAGTMNANGTQVVFTIPAAIAPGSYSVRVGPTVSDISNGVPLVITGDTAPPGIINVRVSNITTTGATITWDTTEPADGQIEVCRTTTVCGVNTPLVSALTTSHVVNVTGLTPNTYNYFWVKSRDGAGNLNTAGPGVFRTRGPEYPYPYNIRLTNLTMTSVTISWNTDVAATSQIEYCTTFTNCGNMTPVDNNLATNHQVVLTGLTEGTRYYAWTRGTSAQGYSAVSSTIYFRTARPPYPFIYDIRVTNVTTTSATVIWTTDIPSDSQVEFCPTFAACGNNTPLNANPVTNHSVTLNGLTAGSRYFFVVKSRSAQGYLSTSYGLGFRAARPTLPGFYDLRITSLTTTSATIFWTTNIPADTQVEYCPSPASCGTYSGLNASLTTDHTSNLTGLTPRTYYYYWLRSRTSNGDLGTAGYFLFRTQ